MKTGSMNTEINVRPATEKLFVYGIFLDENNRNRFGMSNPQYATVPSFVTVGGHIVKAVRVDQKEVALTGLLVDMDSSRWEPLDSLEGGYDRIKVVTTDHEETYMYAQREAGVENFSTYKSKWQ